MAKILVVGGAGYVGSAACAWLLDRGHDVWILDDLSTGYPELILTGPKFVRARAGDRAVVSELLARERFECVMHFAAFALVGESVQNPAKYQENNVDQTQALLEAMLENGVRRFVFSSTCAVFGNPGVPRIHENCPKAPLNPYGETKLQVERMLQEMADRRGLRAIALRYFNAAGAEYRYRVGECHDPETHLIPNVLKAALEKRPVQLFGTDYPTPDGTCIRDYIHVSDLASAHEAALARLLALPDGDSGSFEAFNLGSQNGYSNREVIRACEEVTGRDIEVLEKERRPGDPPMLVGDSALARKELGFEIRHDLRAIIAGAWMWEKKKRGLLKKAVFLDRDGTLNFDPGYIGDPAKLQLLPGAVEGMRALKKAGFLLVVVSNQSGVARGFFKPEVLPHIGARMNELLGPDGAIDHFELCLHHPDENCACRKPKPKLIVDAALKLGIDVSRSYMVGDKVSDLEAGWNAGCRASILVRTGYGKEAEAKNPFKARPGSVGDSLKEAADWILRQESAGS